MNNITTQMALNITTQTALNFMKQQRLEMSDLGDPAYPNIIILQSGH
jgi:hypothetical protein